MCPGLAVCAYSTRTWTTNHALLFEFEAPEGMFCYSTVHHIKNYTEPSAVPCALCMCGADAQKLFQFGSCSMCALTIPSPSPPSSFTKKKRNYELLRLFLSPVPIHALTQPQMSITMLCRATALNAHPFCARVRFSIFSNETNSQEC